MLKLKMLYVLFYCAFGGSLNYFSRYFNILGIDGKITGSIFAVGSLLAMCCQPALGILADKTKRTDKIIIGLLIILFSSVTTMYYIPKLFIIYIAFACYTIAIWGIMPLLDELVLSAHLPFGKIRLFGSVGYALGSVITGKLTTLIGDEAFLIVAGLMAFFSVFQVLTIEKVPTVEHEVTHISDVRELFSNDRYITFLLFSLLYMGVNSSYHAFLSLYFSKIGGSMSRLGVVIMLMTIIEVPFMYYSDMLIEKFGTKKLLLFSGLMFFMRLVGYSLWATPQFMTNSFIFQGLTAGIFFSVAGSYIKGCVSKKVLASAITIYMAAGTLGGTILTMISGILVDAYGVINLQFGLGIISLIATVIFMLPTRVKIFSENRG